MKYLQLISILRDDKSALSEAFLEYEEWTEYKKIMLENIKIKNDYLEKMSNKPAPEDLIIKLFSKSEKHFYIERSNRELYSYENKVTNKKIALIDLYKLIGGDLLEELMEKTQIDITDEDIKRKIGALK